MKIKTSSYVECRANVTYLANRQLRLEAIVLPGASSCCSLGSCCSCSCAIIAAPEQ